MNDLSIVVVSFNTRQLLQNCLESVLRHAGSLRLEIFVVDNASCDGSAELVAERFPGVRLIRNAENRGFATANNQALAQAGGRYAMLLNSDTVVRPGALTELVRFMDDHPRAGYCGPRLLNGDGSLQPSARRFPTIWSTAWAATGLALRCPGSRHALDLHAGQAVAEPFRADWLTGACLMVRAEAMRQVGVLDEGYFMYFEETQWCRRLVAAGWEGWYVPTAEVVHFGGGSVGGAKAGEPFGGDHPVYWVRSRRRYMRQVYGWPGMGFAEFLDIGLCGLLWLKHAWRSSPDSRQKARRARQRLGYLLARGGA